MLTQDFEICGGSVVGSNHIGQPGILLGRNNQDAYGWSANEDALIAVICDGCSKEPLSEFGARFGVDILRSVISAQLNRFTPFGDSGAAKAFWEEVRADALSQMRVFCKTMAGKGSYTNYVKERMFFTSVILLIGKEETQVMAIGDGVAAINGTLYRMGPFPGNKPPYLAYGIIESEFSSTPEFFHFKQVTSLPTSELQHALIGSDGVEEIIERSEYLLPGRQEKLGEPSQFWLDDSYFINGDKVRRHLAAANSMKVRVNREKLEFETYHPLLRDDTTLIALRRKS